MKLETFFEKFDQFADAPGAVAQMRELVLHLAVHGNLVSQSAADEPATELLKRSRAEMAKRMAARQAKQEKPAEPISDDEATFSLPVGWTWCRLVDAGQFINGLPFKPSDWGSVGRPIIRIQNLSGRNLDYNRTTGTFDSSVLVQDGDILVSWSATLDAFVWRGEEGVLNQHIFRVLPAPLADKGFLYWLLKWVIRQLAESDHAHGLVMSHINRGPFLAHPIPLPPLAEQKRIVAKVDELMAMCDRLEAQQQERETRKAALARASLARFADAPTPANLDFLFHKSYAIPPADLRKSILTLAVQGKLVPQDPSDEPAEVSVPMLASLAVASEDDEFPAHWLRVPLGKMGEWRGGGTPSKARPEFWKGDLPWVSPKDMKVLHIADAQDHVSSAAVEGSSVRLIPPGSLLMVVRGMILARAFPVALTMREVTINQDMKALLPTEPKTKEYLLVALRAFEPDVLAAIEHSSHGTCKLKTEFLQDFVMPLPPLAEQRRIVAKVEQLMALVDELETQLAASRVTGADLMKAVVAELTAGKESHAAA